MTVKVLRVNDVVRVIAFIPPGHTHTRLLMELRDGEVLILQQATVDAVVRAHLLVMLHPTRRACELIVKRLSSKERKHGFAEWQLVESGRGEDEVLNYAVKLYSNAVKTLK